MTLTTGFISPTQFERAFLLDPNPWPGSLPERALVQLGLPAKTSVALWLAPQRGKQLAPSVSFPNQQGLQPRFVSVGSTGLLRVEVSGLKPGAAYDISVRTDAQGPSHELCATTAPDTASTAPFSFLISSCFSPFAAPNLIGNLLEGRLSLQGKGERPHIMQRTAHILRLLEQRARASGPDKPAFLLGLGDQIYVDPSDSFGQGMLQGTTSGTKRYQPSAVREFFETVYRATFSLEPYANALQSLPSALMWDDHEIRDGWGSQGDENDKVADWRQHMQTARNYFVAWQGARNPLRDGVATAADYAGAMQLGPDLTRTQELDFCFDWGGLATFFVMDLRSCRNAHANRVVSEDQLARLQSWFAERGDSPTVFVLGSPIPLCHGERWFDQLQRRYIASRKDDMLDAWWSAPLTLQRASVLRIIREHFRSHSAHRLLVVSGDLHFSELLELTDAGGRVFGHEVISSGLAQTYFKLLRGTTPRRTLLADDFAARGIGRFHGPAFAELRVQPSADQARPPGLALTLHTSVTRGGDCLANVAGPSRERLELPLTPLSAPLLRRSQWFEPFIVPDPKRTSATAAAGGAP